MMRYRTAAAFRAGLESNLFRIASLQSGASLSRLRKVIVFDRLLARLLTTNSDGWIVKGGVALDLRLPEHARATKDLDLARQDTLDAVTADLIRAQELDLGDFFIFSIERVAELGFDTQRAHVRFRVRAELAGRLFDEVALDIGLAETIPLFPERTQGTNLLQFAGLSPITVPVLPIELHAAEKLHAYTRRYAGGRESSRAKDLIDLVLIRSIDTITSTELRHAVVNVFVTRNTHPIPNVLPPPPTNWATAYRKMAHETGLDLELATGYALAAAFLDPMLGGDDADQWTWNAVTGRWERLIIP